MDLDAIDRLVAEKVMGYRLVSDTGGRTACWVKSDWPYIPWCFTPTRNSEHAMMVFEQLPGYWCLSHEVDATWLVSNDQECKSMPLGDLVLESAATPTLAICLAALKKAGVEVPQ